MDQDNRRQDRTERLLALSRTTPDSDMGRLLRRFWQPIACSGTLLPGRAKAVRIMGEDLTLYRGASGKPYLVAGRCAHRRTRLHTGWVQGEEVRCMYHGWKYDGMGRCVEMPAEKDTAPQTVKIAGYPVRDYGGLIFAYMGEGAPPSFDMVRKRALDDSGWLRFPREMTWPCNFFQMVENSLDAVHVSFVHQKGHVGTFGEAVTPVIPDLEYLETDSGIRQIAKRGPNNVRVSDWTFPNNNHIIVPGATSDAPWIDVAVWMVPNDDEHTTRFTVYSSPKVSPEADRALTERLNSYHDYNPADHHTELFDEDTYPTESVSQLTAAQDYVAQVGQGAIADRLNERLGRSDAGIALLRRIFWREMDAVRAGRGIKEWRALDEPVDLPMQVPDAAAE